MMKEGIGVGITRFLALLSPLRPLDLKNVCWLQ
jgi:hypothetical protein